MTATELIEIRWHARGGQGAVTAAKMLAEMTLAKGMYFQAFPEYGAERMGAPIQCFNRLSHQKIGIYSAVTDPAYVVVVDITLLRTVDITKGLAHDGNIIINSKKDPATVRELYEIKGRKIATVDATRISQEALGRYMPNIPILGSILKVIGILTLAEAEECLRNSFSNKFAHKIVEGNLKALAMGYNEVIIE